MILDRFVPSLLKKLIYILSEVKTCASLNEVQLFFDIILKNKVAYLKLTEVGNMGSAAHVALDSINSDHSHCSNMILRKTSSSHLNQKMCVYDGIIFYKILSGKFLLIF